MVDAIQTDRSATKQKNLVDVVERLVYYVDELNLKTSVDSEPETPQLLSDILREVEDKYEPYMKEAYSNLLFHVVTNSEYKDKHINILYQIQNMNDINLNDYKVDCPSHINEDNYSKVTIKKFEV